MKMEVNTAQLSADEVAKNKALISKLTATLNIEVIQVNGNNMAAIDPMTNLVASLKQNRGKFTPATGSRIKGRGCGQTSQSCTSDTEEDIEDAINEGAVE